jgi:hypothetical protein
VATGQLQLLALGRAAADEHGVVVLRLEQRAEAGDRRVVLHHHAHAGDVADLLVQHLFGQAECRDVHAHQAAGPRALLEDGALVAQWHQVVGHGQRRRARAHQRDFLPVLRRGGRGQPIADVVLVVGRHALQAADGHGLAVHARAPARRLAGTVAGPAENARKHVRFAIDDVGVTEPALGDEPDVLGHVGVGRAGPLAIDDLMVVVRVPDVRTLHIPAIICGTRPRRPDSREVRAAARYRKIRPTPM